MVSAYRIASLTCPKNSLFFSHSHLYKCVAKGLNVRAHERRVAREVAGLFPEEFRKTPEGQKLEKAVLGQPLYVGDVLPDFEVLTTGLKKVKLSGILRKGHYTLVELWASWCGPCRGELPALKELEEKYAGKDIHFVSLSCDKNKKAWENMVTKDQLKGIQLHMGTDRTFMDAYLINGIPRFILLDRDGKIISANMTRPSDPKTAEKFNELLGL